MRFDLNNKVVKLCADGMNAEAQGDIDAAANLFQQAWDAATDDFEKFTAAHYMSRNREDASVELHWNETALDHALAMTDDEARSHYPSLYLNVGRSYEKLGDNELARQHYQLAAEFSESLASGAYTDMIRSGIKAGLQRTGAARPAMELLSKMIDKWCEQKALRPLSFVLPVFVSYLGTEQDRNKLISALSYLSATRCLDEKDQQNTDALIAELSAEE